MGQSQQLNGSVHNAEISDEDKTRILLLNADPPINVQSCIHECILDRVTQQPNAEAVSAWDGSFTYQELWEQASLVASRLADIEIGPEQIVPLCFDKSKWSVVAILGVLMGGCAVLTLDPGHPAKRLRHLTRKVRAKIVLCSQGYVELFAETVNKVLVLDQILMGNLSSRATDMCLPSLPHSGAYIVFTSGTTGEPKGAVISHCAFLSSSEAFSRAMLMTPNSRVLHFSAPSFDPSMAETLTTLVVGGCICIPSEDERLHNLAQAMQRLCVNWAVLTPSFIQTLLHPSEVPGLRTLVVGGEPMAEAIVKAWSHINLVQNYGPAEAAIISHVTPLIRTDSDPRNIGLPRGIRCWVVDSNDHNRLVSLGCIGELLIEGHTLSSGYFDNKKATAEAFTIDPVWSVSQRLGSQRRMYKTGDLVRCNYDGTYVFLGRKDSQIKFHGQRMEVAEIEHHLRLCNLIQDAAVTFPRTGLYQERLVAVIQLESGQSRSDSSNKTHFVPLGESEREQAISCISSAKTRLSKSLPAAMIPTAWLCSINVPRMRSGKLDRSVISRWVAEMDSSTCQQFSPAFHPPQNNSTSTTLTEKLIREVWADVLNLSSDQIDAQSSFLSQGGDSITAMQVARKCRAQDIGLNVRNILRSKSIKHLITSIKAVESSNQQSADVLGQPFELSPIQRLYFSKIWHRRGHFNQSFLLRCNRAIEETALRKAIETVVSRHSMLRARFLRDHNGNNWRQVITDEVLSSVRVRNLQIEDEDQIGKLTAESQTCLNAVLGPLFAVDLIEVNAEKQFLFLTSHHLVIDLVSWRVILNELEELLAAPDRALAPNSSMSFQAWCQLQLEDSQTRDIERVIPINRIPISDFDYWGMTNEPHTYGEVRRQQFEIPIDNCSALLTSCHHALRTELQDVLMAALILSFRQVFRDRTTPPIFSEGHGRETWDSSTDISGTVGWFTTMYPVFVEASEDWLEVVRAVKDLRRQTPENGRQYWASRWLTDQGREAFRHHTPEVTFNYLGQYQQLERKDALFTAVNEIAGEAAGASECSDVGHDTPCAALIEISAVIVQGRLRFSFIYSSKMRHQEELRRWISSCEQFIPTLALELSELDPQPTAGDFPLITLPQKQFQALKHVILHQAGISRFEEVEDIYPCSAIQQGLLVTVKQDASLYSCFTLQEVRSTKGDLVDPGRLAAAWTFIVARHPMLRTVFVESVGQQGILYNQVVLRCVDPNILQLSQDSDSDAVKCLNKQSEGTVHETRRLMHRFTICTASSGKVFCKLEISHIISDGTSLTLLFRDLMDAYDDKLSDSGPLFSNFISYLQRLDIPSGIEYWKTRLSEAEPCHFPTLNDGQAKNRRLGSVRVDFKEFAELQSFCDTQGLTFSNAIHAAWSLTLRYYTESDQIHFGYVSSARDAPVDGVQHAIGPFITTLICSVSLAENLRLVDVMSRIQNDHLDSLPHQHVALAEVLHALGLSSVPLFNSVISYRKITHEDKFSGRSVAFDELAPTYDPDEYRVSINIEAVGEDVRVYLRYWNDHICDGQADNIASTFAKSLHNIVHNAYQPIGSLNSLSDQGREQILRWNNKQTEVVENCVHSVLEQQAKQTPNAPAICGWDAEFSYNELENAANKLSGLLIREGIQLEEPVLLCFEKSAFAIVAMLAVLKAGGVCVPTDPTYPVQMLEHRARDAAVKLVLSASKYKDLLRQAVAKNIVVDARLLDSIENSYMEQRVVKPNNACFIIYTSGSTGTAKGIVLEHSNITTSAKAHASLLGYQYDSRVLQFSSYAFDNSLAEMFTTLQNGGCVCVASDHDRLNDLAGAIGRLQVNMLDITPSVAVLLKPTEIPTVRRLALGGEVVTTAVIEVWKDALSIDSCYGPSECSIKCAYSGEVSKPGKAANIGRPCGSLGWVVDAKDHNRLVPIGCVGELVIEGPLLSRGYLNDQKKTASSFIEDPAWSTQLRGVLAKKCRMYKTGDLVRYDSDGTLVYMGRKDQQVKVNGQRVEIGEIESQVARELPEGSRCAVEFASLDNDNTKRKEIVAFLCLESNSSLRAVDDVLALPPSASFLALSEQLQSKMNTVLMSSVVPRTWVLVSAIPVTNSRKVDRGKLRQITRSLTSEQIAGYRLSRQSGPSPSTDMEKLLAQLWGTVLHRDSSSIGIDDDFFKLGGDSIGAIELVTAARSKSLTLSVACVFSNRSLSQMASSMTQAHETSPEDIAAFSLVRNAEKLPDFKAHIASQCQVQVEDIVDAYPCTPLQEGMMALSIPDPGSYVARMVYPLPTDVDCERLRAAWNVVFDAEPILRTRILHVDGLEFLQVVVQDSITWESDLEACSDTGRHLPKYNGGPLVRFALTGALSDAPNFILTIHHSLYDGWCLPAIFEKVETCYKSYNSLEIRSGPPFARFVKHLSEVNISASNDFWTAELADVKAPQFPKLPAGDYQGNAPDLMNFTVDVCCRAGSEVTAASTLRSAWAMSASIYSGSDDVLFYETVTGRDSPVPEITSIAGPTISTVPRSFRIKRQQTIIQFLRETQSKSVAAVPHQLVGLQNIKRLSSDTAKACNSETLLSIESRTRDRADGLWSHGDQQMAGTNFFTYPLTITCHIEDTKIEVTAHYDESILPKWKMEGLFHCFAHIIKQFSSGYFDQESMGNMEIVGPKDKSTIQGWNKTTPPIIDQCIHNLITERASLSAETKLAVDSWDGSFTYQQLDRLSTSLAHKLVSIGVRNQMVILLCFEKSAWPIVAMLAILKCGASYASLDPSSHKDHNRGIIQSVGASIVLCSPKHERLCRSFEAEVFVINRAMVEALPTATSFHTPCATDNVAYVIFSSGTTGKPKGILVEHRALSTSAIAHASAMHLSASSRVLQFSSYTFDASIVEILTTLIVGGCVCVPDDETRLNNLNHFISTMRINFALLTPSLVSIVQLPDDTPLRTLVLIGETVSPGYLSRLPNSVQVMNGYGPTEAAAVATVSTEVSFDNMSPIIGYAVGGRSWVVDSSNSDRLVPIGTMGELLIEGPILARGYLNDPSRTAAAFIKSPRWSEDPASNCYKTGDLVQYANDGRLIFLGRKDNQIKLRGQRIDLKEIEASLLMDEAVRESMIIVPSSGWCKDRVLAIVVLQDVKTRRFGSDAIHTVEWAKATPPLTTLRDRVKGQLASHAVPEGWVACYNFPLLSSGKLDRQKVRKWTETIEDGLGQRILGLGTVTSHVSRAATPTESLLHSAWSRVLNLPERKITLNQSFLQSGGDSLSAISAVAYCRTQGLNITVKDIMQSGSIPELAACAKATSKLSPPVEDTEGAFDLSPIQQLYFDRIDDGSAQFAQSVVLRLNRPVDYSKLEQAVESLVASHAMLRARFLKDDTGTWKQQVVKDVLGSYCIYRHDEPMSLQQISSKIGESKQNLNAQKGPLFAVVAFARPEGSTRTILSLSAHHLAIDVISWRIVIDHLEQLLAGRQPQPTSLPFQTWCRIQAERSNEDNFTRLLSAHEVPEADLDYWGMKEKTNLRGDTVSFDFELDTSISMLVMNACRENTLGTPIDLFVAALMKSFTDVFADKPSAPPIYNEGHGREPWGSEIDLTQTVGWFTTLSPIYIPHLFLESANMLQVCQWIKQAREQSQDNGRSYFAFRTLTNEGRTRFSGHWPMEITFNYLGQLDTSEYRGTLLTPLDQKSQQLLTGGSEIGSNVPRFSLFEILAFVNRGKIVFSFRWNNQMRHQTSIRQWADGCKQILSQVIDSAVPRGDNSVISSLPHISLSRTGSDNLIGQLKTIGLSIHAIEGVCPCSSVQEGILLAQTHRPEYYAYRTGFKVRAVNTTRLVAPHQVAAAWQEVVHRHAALRTIYIEGISELGQRHQVVLKRAPAGIDWIQCTEAEAIALLTNPKQAPRHYSPCQPPHHLTLCTVLETGDVYCSLEISHAVMDGSSMAIILRDLIAAYDGQLPRSPAPPVYRSHSTYLQQTASPSTLSYWLSYLDGVEPCHFPRIKDEPESIRELRFVKQNLTAWPEVLTFASHNSITPSSVFQLAWGLVLKAYTNSSDVCFAYLSSGRDLPIGDIEDAVGCFVNLLVCRLRLPNDSRVQTTLRQIREDTTHGLSHQNVSLAEIQHKLATVSNGPLFNTAYSFQRRASAFSATGLDDEAASLDFDMVHTQDPSEYDIAVNIEAKDNNAGLHMSYWIDKLSNTQAENVASLFNHVLHMIVQTPDHTIGELDLLSNHQSKQIASWNEKLPAAVNSCIHEIVAQNVSMLPSSAQAVHGWDRSYTYLELDTKSTLLAGHLRSLGVGPGNFVPLCFEKSAFIVVAILAVLKAGAAFVPLDPKHPVARLGEIVMEIQSDIMLCSTKFQDTYTSIVHSAIAVDDSLLTNISTIDTELPHHSHTSAAYVIYTSGSTGKPKGVIMEHGSFCTSAVSHGEQLNMQASSRVLQFASYAFDGSMLEILTALICKACVCVPSERMRLDDLSGAINDMQISWALLTPSVIQTIGPSMVPHLRTLVLGAEVASEAQISLWAGSVELINGYGPTECAVVSVVNRQPHIYGPENIGRAVGGRCWIVDASDQDLLVPIGCVGELVIEGSILARGYFNDPEKTKKSFIDRPRWASTGSHLGKDVQRIYKTGDLVRYASDGTIVFHGRKDTQTKLHGQRIEVSEIEHCLRADGKVENALVTVPIRGKFKSRLVVALSLRTSERESSNIEDLVAIDSRITVGFLPDIRERVSELLPTYMIPSRWLVVERLPLTSSAKLDRKKIKQWIECMDNDEVKLFSNGEIPSRALPSKASSLEMRLRAIWAHSIGLPEEQISFSQSFLEQGGDSIVAMQVVGRARSEDISVSVNDVLRCKSIQELATKAADTKISPSIPEQTNTNFTLSPIQQLFFETVTVNFDHFNHSVMFNLKAGISAATIEQAIGTIITLHTMLRARFRKTSVWKQMISDDIQGSYLFKNHGMVATDPAHLIRKSQQSLDIQHGPLVAVDLFQTRNHQSQSLNVVVHHLVIDVVSWHIIIQDLDNILRTGQVNLRKPLSFQAWCHLQEEQAQQESAKDGMLGLEFPIVNLDYWGLQQSYNVHGETTEISFELDPETTALFLGDCHRALRTDAADLCLAVLLKSFNRVFSDKTTVIHNEGHGREPWRSDIDVSRTVGWFTTLCPVWLPKSARKDEDIIGAVQWVKDLRRRIPGKGRPYFYSRMLGNEGREEFASHSAIETTFNWLGQVKRFENSKGAIESADLLSIGDDSSVGSDVPRFSLIDIVAFASGGRAKFSFTYHKRMRHEEKIRSWITECHKLLREVVERLTQTDRQLTMDDFPGLPLTLAGPEAMRKRLLSIGITSFNEVEDAIPCTALQYGMLLKQAEDHSYYSYKTIIHPKSLRPNHVVSVERLATAWSRVVQRHPALRAIFIENFLNDGKTCQIVLKRAKANISLLDCTDSGIVDYLQRQPSEIYLPAQPPHRLTISKTRTGDIYCLLEMSHAIIDGTSIAIVLRDLTTAYQGQSLGSGAPDSHDYVTHLRHSLDQSDISYWLQYLKGAEPCYFPALTDNVSSDTRIMRYYKTDLGQWQKILAIASRNNVTPSSILQLIWGLVLKAYVNAADVCFGYLVSGRDAQGTSDAVGVFINMLVCRLQLSDDLSLRTALDRINSDVASGMSNQNISLAKIQHGLALSGKSLFNTAYSFQKNRKVAEQETSLLRLEVLHASDPSEYDITINVEVENQNAELELCYWSDKLSDGQARNIVSTFNQLMNEIASSPSLAVTIGELRLLSDHCRGQLGLWNRARPVAIEKCIHQIFLDNTRRHPDSPAVYGWDGEFTYARLEKMSLWLSRRLTALGVGPNMYVPLLFDKSVWTIVAMLAVLRAGAAFVPLDPNHPSSRLRQLIHSVDARIVLCSEGHEKLLEGTGISAFEVGATSVAALENDQGPALLDMMRPGDAACILFTSGTTGVPKGTILEHAAFATGAVAHSDAMGIVPTSRVFQFASYTWDASIMEILSTLIVGGCVCVPTDEERTNDMAGVMERMRVTWTLLTPSVASILQPKSVPSLKTMVTAGEPMSQGHISKWAASTSVVNAYGPCECSVVATASVKVDLSGKVLDTVPANIGRAVGSRSWVVDPSNHDKLMPIGAIGELVAEGRTVARGYLNDNDRTAEAFITQPSWYVPGELHIDGVEQVRMYKTGDLVRYNSDGTLVYLGRKDSQIKLNGQRIELGEIEHCIRQYLPTGATAAVELITYNDSATAKTLAMFLPLPASSASSADISHSKQDQLLLPLSEEAAAASALLGTSLATSLPSYMIPSLCIPITGMPLTASGKLDRRRLRDTAQQLCLDQRSSYMLSNIHNNTQGDENHSSESNSVVLLKSIWSQVLKIPRDRISTNTSFLALGGDSIATMQVMALCREEGILLTLRDVLRSKSIAQLAEILELRPSAESHMLTQSTEKIGQTFPLSPIQQMFLRTVKHGRTINWYNQSFLLRLVKAKTSREVEQAVEEIVDRHSMLRARFSKNEDVWEQRITVETDSSYCYRSIDVKDMKDIIPVIHANQTSMDICNGPLLRVVLFNVDGLGQVLYLVAHHFVVDAVSWLTILHDFETALEQRPRSSTKPLSFQRWCDEQAEQTRKIASKGQHLLPFEVPLSDMKYWGMDKASNAYGDVIQEDFIIDQSTTNLLLVDSHKAFNTESVDIMLSAIMQTFSRTFPDRDVPAIFNEGHGRESWDPAIDPSGTVGWFTCISPVYVDVTNDDYLQTLRQVKDVRRKISGSGQPYFTHSLLSEEPTARSRDHEPMEIMFNYLGRTRQVGHQDSVLTTLDHPMTTEELEMTADVSPAISRMALVEISAILSDDGLHFAFSFNKHMRYQDKLRSWVFDCKQMLEKSASLLSTLPRSPTLSDLPSLPMTSYTQLQFLIEELSSTCDISDFSNVQDIYPCSPMQEGILLGQYKKAGRYQLSSTFEVRPGSSATPVDTQRLRAAWNNVVNRHAILRTIFVHANYKDGSICQVVLKQMSCEVPIVRCRDLEAIEKLEKAAADANHKPTGGKPLHELTTYETIEGKTFLKIKLNHAIVDGTSMGIIVQDLSNAYNKQAALPMAESYGEYVKYINEKKLASNAYWIDHLHGSLPCTFPVDSCVQDHLGYHSMKFERLAKLHTRCVELGVTASSAILTAWALVLRLYTNSDDVCFGYLASGRDAPIKGVHDIVGPLINMLVLRTGLDSSQVLGSLVQEIQRLHLENTSYQHASWTRVQHELKIPQSGLFNTAVSIQQIDVVVEHQEGIQLEPVLSHDPSEYAITLNVNMSDADGGITLAYWEDVLSTTRIEEIASALTGILDTLIDVPHTRISHMKLPDLDSCEWDYITSPANANSDLQRVQEHPLENGNSYVAPPSIDYPSNSCDQQPSQHSQYMASKAKLRSLWARAMDLAEDLIGDDDDFFKLGGDSMLALSMASMARDQGIRVSVYDIFQNSSLREMASAICNPGAKVQNTNGFITKTEETSREKIRGQVAMSSTIREHNTDQFEDVVCQVLKCTKEQIQNVSPVTDYQSLAIGGMMLECQWMLNYFYVDWRGPLHVERFEDSVRHLIEQEDILRTVFVLHEGQYLQTVLRQRMPHIEYHETDELAKFTHGFEHERHRYLPQLGQSYLQFTVVKCSRSNIARIFMRLSHAQYDGISLPRTLIVLRSFYDGVEVPVAQSFSAYMSQYTQSRTAESYGYWKHLLDGAKMTPIVRREQPAKPRLFRQSVTQTIDCRKLISSGITPASIVKAAWSLTLAKFSASADIVFGTLVSGRNSSPLGAEAVAGPCLNMIPVRITLKDGWTVLDLMKHVQNQQVQSMPHESLGFLEITKHCTDWPAWTTFATLVQHQGPVENLDACIRGNVVGTGCIGSEVGFADVSVVSKMADAHNVDISLSCPSDGEISPAFAESILDMLCGSVMRFARNPNAVLPTPADLTSLPSQVLTASSSSPKSSARKWASGADSQSLMDYLASVWAQALPSAALDLGDVTLDISFFALGGDIIDLSKVAAILRGADYGIYLDELIERPLFGDQIALLSTKSVE